MSEQTGFSECVRAALGSPEFIEQWARVRGIKISGSPLEASIDRATGYDSHVAQTFLADVYDLIYLRLPR